MEKRILEIEFDSKNYEKIDYLFDGLCIMYRMDSGTYIDYFDGVLGKNNRTLKTLKELVDSTNYDIQRMKEQMIMNGTNPNWLKEYKDIVLEDYLYLLA